MLATYAPTCESLGVKVDWKREAGASLRIWGDRDLLEQVLGNLFRNSLQALETIPNSSAEVPWVGWALGAAETGRVWLRIEDNGPGVASVVRERLFTPFVTTRAQGTGLGLSFVKKVVDDHGGSIRCLDRPGGSGACFELILPDVDSRPEVPTSKNSEVSPHA